MKFLKESLQEFSEQLLEKFLEKSQEEFLEKFLKQFLEESGSITSRTLGEAARGILGEISEF